MGAWPCANAQGTVLLFPGRTEYVEKYGRAARDLAARGFATLAVDWRGQGIADRMTDNPLQGHVGRFSDYQLDVAGVLDAAKAMNLPKPYHLIGHSMGGCIGLRSLYEGLPVESAVFTGPMWGFSLPVVSRPFVWLLAGVAKLVGLGKLYVPGVVRDAYVLITPFQGNKLTKDKDMYEYMIRQTRAHMPVALAGPTLGWLFEGLMETRALSRKQAPDLPCLTFVGSDERIVDVDAILGRMADWDNGRLEMIEGGDHEVIMDTPEVRKRLFDAIAAHFHASAGTSAPNVAPENGVLTSINR